MVLIEHGSDSIEPEPIDIVLVHIPGEITEKQAQHFPLAVIVHLRIPLSVIPSFAFMEVLVVSAIPKIEPIVHVLARMPIPRFKSVA